MLHRARLLSSSSRLRPVLTGWLAAALLAGCGGGVSIGIGIGDDFDDCCAPSVALAAPASVSAPGQPVRLEAAASDDWGIDVVAFYRIDDGRSVFLGEDDRAPYVFVDSFPSDGRQSVQYFARATDFHGRRSDSQRVTVQLQP